jgi:hypothetical protein
MAKRIAWCVGILLVMVGTATAYADYSPFYDNIPGNVSGGSVSGGGSSTDNAIARWDGVSATVLQDGPLICADTGALTGVYRLTFDSNNTSTVANTSYIESTTLGAIVFGDGTNTTTLTLGTNSITANDAFASTGSTADGATLALSALDSGTAQVFGVDTDGNAQFDGTLAVGTTEVAEATAMLNVRGITSGTASRILVNHSAAASGSDSVLDLLVGSGTPDAYIRMGITGSTMSYIGMDNSDFDAIVLGHHATGTFAGGNVMRIVPASVTTEDAVQIVGDGLTDGDALQVSSNSADTSARAVARIVNDNAAATGTTALYVQQDSTGLGIDTTGDIRTSGGDITINGTAPKMSFEDTTGGNNTDGQWGMDGGTMSLLYDTDSNGVYESTVLQATSSGVTLSGDLAVNGGDITSTASTVNLLTTTNTGTVNIATGLTTGALAIGSSENTSTLALGGGGGSGTVTIGSTTRTTSVAGPLTLPAAGTVTWAGRSVLSSGADGALTLTDSGSTSSTTFTTDGGGLWIDDDFGAGEASEGARFHAECSDAAGSDLGLQIDDSDDELVASIDSDGHAVFAGGLSVGSTTETTTSGSATFNANAASAQAVLVRNQAANAAAASRVQIETAASGGDPGLALSDDGGSNAWVVGMDNSANNGSLYFDRIASFTGSMDTSPVVQFATDGFVQSTGYAAVKDAVGEYTQIGAQNLDNTDPASHATMLLTVGGASGGDPFGAYTISGVGGWAVGANNDESGEFHWNWAASPGAVELGNAPAMSLDTTGQLSVAGNFIAEGNVSLNSGVLALTNANAPGTVQMTLSDSGGGDDVQWLLNGSTFALAADTDDDGSFEQGVVSFNTVNGNATFTGDLAVNGGDITSDGTTLVINAAGEVELQDNVSVTGGLAVGTGTAETTAGRITVQESVLAGADNGEGFYLGLAAAGFYHNATDPLLQFDTDDYIYYSRSGNRFDVNIGGGTAEHQVLANGKSLFHADAANDYAIYVLNDGNNQNRYGIDVQAGADDGSGTTYYFQAKTGDGTVTGNLNTTGGVFALADVSDQRLKQGIKAKTESGLDMLRAIGVYEFDWKSSGEHVRWGFVAQDLQKAYPEAVAPLSNGFLSEMRTHLVPVLVKAVQEIADSIAALWDSIDDHDARIAELEAENAALEARLSALEARQ